MQRLTDFYIAYIEVLRAKSYSKCFTHVNSFKH